MMGIPVWGSGPSFVLTESGGATFTLNCKGDNKSRKQWVNEATNQWLNECVSQWISEWVSELVSRWINETLNQWTGESMKQWTNESMNPWIKWINEKQRSNEPMSQWTVNESMNQWTNQTVDQWTNELMKHYKYESTSQWSSEAMNQWIKDLWSNTNSTTSESRNQRLTESTNPWTNESMNQGTMNQWFNESMSEPMDELMDEWAIPSWATPSLSDIYAEVPILFSQLLLLWRSELPPSYLFCSFCKQIIFFAHLLQCV